MKQKNLFVLIKNNWWNYTSAWKFKKKPKYFVQLA